MPEFPIKQIVLLLDNRFDENWGSQATTSELVRGLQATYPGASITGIRRTAIRNPKWAFSIGYRWAPRGPSSNWRNPLGKLGTHLLMRNWKSALESADLVVVNGEGTLHPQPQAFAWLSVMGQIIESKRCLVWVVNCSIDAGDGTMDSLLDQVLSYVDRLVVREPESHRFGINRGWKAELAADCAFLAEVEPVQAVDSWLARHRIEGPFALVTGSAHAGNWQVENVKLWMEAIRDQGLTIVFAASTQTDHSLYERLGLEMPLFSGREFDFRSLIALTDRASLHVGGRFHPTIFAACSGTPFIAIGSKSQKISGLMELLQTQRQLFDSTNTVEIVDAIRCLSVGEKSMDMIEHCKTLGVSAKSNFRAQP